MAAYSAVVSFRQTLKQLLDSDQYTLVLPKRQIESLHENVCLLQHSIDRVPFLPKKRRHDMNMLQTRIRNAIHEAQDRIDYSIVKGLSFEKSDEIWFKKIAEDVDLMAKEVVKMAKAIRNDLEKQNLFPENTLHFESSWSGMKDRRIVGQEEEFKKINDWLELDNKELLLIPITGLPGIGKTTLAKSIYVFQQSRNQFNIRAWVTVSEEYNYQEIFSKLLSSMESKKYQAGHYTTEGDEQTLRNRLHQELYNRRYLIVIDDIWDSHVWDRIKLALPYTENGSRILFTTRIQNLAGSIQKTSGFSLKMKPLSLDDSWSLLCDCVFGDHHCPPHLRDIGWSIMKKCKGLPLSIKVVGGLLSQRSQKLEYWERIEEDVAVAATQGEDSYLEILYLSYYHLPAKLKGCFLYMGAFPEDSEILVSKLIKLWVAEGFFPTSTPGRDLEVVARDSLEELIGRNLISVRKISPNGRVKVCGVHVSLQKLAEYESQGENLLYSRKKYAQDLESDAQIQRRVSIHRNNLMCLEEVYESMKSIKFARSLLYLGPHHHRPLPFCLTFDLLRVLDAFSVYFIEFPREFLQLIHLTYLSLTYNDDLPSKISQLQKLQVLMVRRQPKIIFVGVSFLPDEIWEMPQLRHLWFTETDLPTLPHKIDVNRALLVNLQTLANVNAAFLTDEVLDNVPNLKKLSMWIEGPEAINFNLAKMSKLESFKFVVLNPIPGKGIEVEPENFFPKTVRRLHLSGCGLPWHYMEFVAAELQVLEVLKLRELAFYGEEWRLDYQLRKLKFLSIEYLDFKVWEANEANFPSLQHLILRHCYQLEEIPSDFQYIWPLELIELVNCSPNVVSSAENIKGEKDGWQSFQVHIFTSWEKKI